MPSLFASCIAILTLFTWKHVNQISPEFRKLLLLLWVSLMFSCHCCHKDGSKLMCMWKGLCEHPRVFLPWGDITRTPSDIETLLTRAQPFKTDGDNLSFSRFAMRMWRSPSKERSCLGTWCSNLSSGRKALQTHGWQSSSMGLWLMRVALSSWLTLETHVHPTVWLICNSNARGLQQIQRHFVLDTPMCRLEESFAMRSLCLWSSWQDLETLVQMGRQCNWSGTHLGKEIKLRSWPLMYCSLCHLRCDSHPGI